jgi:hypothetical protein
MAFEYLSGKLTGHYVVVEKVRKRSAVSKQETQKFDMEKFNLRKPLSWRLGNSIRLRSQTGLQLWLT